MNHIVKRIRAGIAAAANARFDAEGRELPDPTPVEVPLGFRKPQLTIEEQIRRALRSQEVMRAQEARGEETLDDSMYFGPDEDPSDGLPTSPHEVRDMREDLLRQGALEAERKARRERSAQKQEPKPKAEEVKPEKKDEAKKKDDKVDE